jgi:hypothetical protein
MKIRLPKKWDGSTDWEGLFVGLFFGTIVAVTIVVGICTSAIMIKSTFEMVTHDCSTT